MAQAREADHYEALQISPRADAETIERVFRHLAKRFHPDNGETGDSDRFAQIVAAYRVLSNAERRAQYDAGYSDLQRETWKIFDQASSTSNVESDKRIRTGILTVLYQARRRDVDRPGVGQLELEHVLDCPQEVMKFHLWYMKESGWIQRLDTGLLAITYQGVNQLHQQEIPWADESHRLGPVSTVREAGPVADHSAPPGEAGTPGTEATHSHPGGHPPDPATPLPHGEAAHYGGWQG